jgi:acyl carrier protein
VKPSIVERVQRIAADVFEVPGEELTPQSSPDTVPTWDSMHHLALVLALEPEFGVEFSPEEIEQLLSLELVADLIAEKWKITGVNECLSNSDMPGQMSTAGSAGF